MLVTNLNLFAVSVCEQPQTGQLENLNTMLHPQAQFDNLLITHNPSDLRFDLNVDLVLSECRYVTQKDTHTNTIYVSRNYYSIDKERNTFTCEDMNWINGPADLSVPVCCKVRHGPTIYQCHVSFIDDQQTAMLVKLDGNDQGLASGQYAVFYQGEVCIGSGVIQTTSCSQYTDLPLTDDGVQVPDSYL